MELLWNVRQVAAALGVGVRTVWDWADNGDMPPPIRLGRLRRWRPSDIESWLARRAAEAAGEVQSGPAGGGAA